MTMSMGRPPFGAETPRFVYAPPNDEGQFAIDPRRAGQMVLSGEAGQPSVPDSDKVSEAFDKLMRDYYGEERDFAGHNDQILDLYKDYFGGKKIAGDEATIEVKRMAVGLHDPVEHLIMEPERTAAKLKQLDPWQATEIKDAAIHALRLLLGADEPAVGEQPMKVEDRNGLAQAYLFAIDASHWETAARSWRDEAVEMMDEPHVRAEFSEHEAAITKAAITKTPLPEGVDKTEQEAVLKRAARHLMDLKLHAIDESTLKHNIEGLVIKGLETFVNILDPPENNFASTFRDCIEALNFFVPALTLLGHQRLATDLRGAVLEQLFDDPHSDAARQRALSERYKARMDNIVLTRLTEQFSGMEAEALDDLKTNGSTRKKLVEKGLSRVSDGIRYAFIVPDGMSWDEMKQHALAFQDSLTGESERIIAKHPDPDEQTFEEVVRRSGYEAIHMTFYYYPEDGDGEGVPFEIQVMTRSQHEMKRYGRWSDLFYQAGKRVLTPEEFMEVGRPYLERMKRRAQAASELPPGTTVESIAEALALTGEEVPFVFSELFQAVRIGESRLLVPHELSGLAGAIADRFAKVTAGERDSIVLPPTKVTEEQFKKALRMFDSDLMDAEGEINDLNIANALKLVKDLEAGSKRNDEKTPVVEGHLLPVALSALMLAIQSGRIWDHKELSPKQFMSNIVTITLLHDYVEKHLDEVKDASPADIVQKRQELLYEVKRMFGTEIMEAVDALTVPLEIKDHSKRHQQYTHNIKGNEYARIIKPADRDQNHITDLVVLLALNRKAELDEADQTVYQKKAREYPAKTDSYLTAEFTALDMPRAYTQMHDAVWEFIKYFGYQPEQAQSGDK